MSTLDSGRTQASPGVGVSRRARPRKLSQKAPEPRPTSVESEPGGVALISEEVKTERRKPRKLNKNIANITGVAANDSPKVSAGKNGSGLDIEVEALKERVVSLEEQIKDLYSRPVAKGSPRRRGRRRKNTGATQENTTETELSPENEAGGKENDLARLEDDLHSARAELAALTSQTTPKQASKGSTESEEIVEEIPRARSPQLQAQNNSQKQVTLSGSYRIPLPENISLDDVRAIQQGVKSASVLARGLYNAGKRAKQDQPQQQQGNWSEWFGGYNLSITRLMRDLSHDSAFETASQTQKTTSRRGITRSSSDGPSTSVLGARNAAASPGSSRRASTSVVPQTKIKNPSADMANV